jgi:DNA-binding IclR family transcriptional regulator
MPDQYKTTDLIQGKVLAVLPWEGGCKIEAIVRYTSIDEDTVRRALEDLVRRRMVTIDNRNYWHKKPLD